MTKDEILKKQKQYLFPSVSTYYSDPLVTDHASMQHIWDVEGNKYLDFFGGIVTISVGHANPRVTSKIKAQVEGLFKDLPGRKLVPDVHRNRDVWLGKAGHQAVFDHPFGTRYGFLGGLANQDESSVPAALAVCHDRRRRDQ